MAFGGFFRGYTDYLKQQYNKLMLTEDNHHDDEVVKYKVSRQGALRCPSRRLAEAGGNTSLS